MTVIHSSNLLHPLIDVLHWYTVKYYEIKRIFEHTRLIMPSSSVKAAETTSYDGVRATPFTRIHGRPTRQDYELLKKEASDAASKVENITFTWSCDTATGEE